MAENDSLVDGFKKLALDKPHYNLVFMGNVDAGKSTLCGQIMFKTNQVDARLLEKYKQLAKDNNRESWWVAYIMDTNEEERAKGKTVEVGMARFETKQRRYTILDAPGHKNYVPAMISGASQADIGILVVSARKGEFEAGFQRGGQTKEHALLAITLGVKKIIIAVNKMDDETVNWDQTRYSAIAAKVSAFLRSCGYKPKDVCSLPLSALGGDLLCAAAPAAAWYGGEPLFDLLDQQRVAFSARPELRVPVVERYRDMGVVVATGKIISGRVSVGDALVVMPHGVETECDSIKIDDESVQSAGCGENVNIHLKGIDVTDIDSGNLICSRDSPSHKASLLNCEIFIIELLPHKPLVTVGYTCVFHCHSVVAACEIKKLGMVQ